MTSSRIVIAGGGLAGLTLAKCLKASNIPSIVLQSTFKSATNAYGIDLHPWSYVLLLKFLDMDLARFRQLFDLRVGCKRGQNPHNNDSGAAATIRCQRGLLGRWLAEGLDVRWGQNAEDVDLHPLIIKVRAEDQIIELPADILIAADGVHSKIRKSLAPHLIKETNVKVLPYVVFNSRRQMSQQAFKGFTKCQTLQEPFRRIQRGQISLSVELNEYGDGKQAIVNYTYSRPVKSDAPDPLYMPKRAPEEAKSGPGNGWKEFEHELKQLEGLPPLFQKLFNPQSVSNDRVLNWLMRSGLVPLGDLRILAKHKILLIGDAAHATPILGGEGANLAIKDAVELAQDIVCSGHAGLVSFADRTYASWAKHVQESEQRLAKMHFAGHDAVKTSNPLNSMC